MADTEQQPVDQQVTEKLSPRELELRTIQIAIRFLGLFLVIHGTIKIAIPLLLVLSLVIMIAIPLFLVFFLAGLDEVNGEKLVSITQQLLSNCSIKYNLFSKYIWQTHNSLLSIQKRPPHNRL